MSSIVFSLAAIAIYVLVPTAVAFALFWVVRLGVRFGLRDHETWRESRSPNLPPEGA
jgi:hypothetical protein